MKSRRSIGFLPAHYPALFDFGLTAFPVVVILDYGMAARPSPWPAAFFGPWPGNRVFWFPRVKNIIVARRIEPRPPGE
jgi:hypothetical protein